MAIIRIERQTDAETIKDEIFDKSRTKTIYFLGFKVFSFKWIINNPKDTNSKKTIGFK